MVVDAGSPFHERGRPARRRSDTFPAAMASAILDRGNPSKTTRQPIHAFRRGACLSRLVLHIGSHKTGTTSIQQLLNGVGEQVAELTGLTYVPLQPGRHRATSKPSDELEFQTEGARIRPEFVDRLGQLGTDCLVVEEEFSWIFKPQQINTTLDLLERLFDDIRIVVYVRRQDRHLVSHYQQAARFNSAKFFRSRLTALPDYEPHHDRYLDYHARLAPYVERLGLERVTLRVYERDLLKDRDVTSDFLALLGVERAHLPGRDDKHANVSTGKTATKIGHLYNEIPDRQLNSRILTNALPSDPKLMPARHEARAIVERYQASNIRLAELFELDSPIFPDGFDEFGAKSNEAWTPDEVVAALAGLRRLTLLIGRQQGIEVGDSVLPKSVRALRRQAQQGQLPSETSVNDRLRLVLARLNALALGRPDWELARPD